MKVYYQIQDHGGAEDERTIIGDNRNYTLKGYAALVINQGGRLALSFWWDIMKMKSHLNNFPLFYNYDNANLQKT